MISAEVAEIIDTLDCDLYVLNVTNTGRSVELAFTFAGFLNGEGHDVILHLLGVERLEYRIDADRGGHFVGEAHLTEQDGKLQLTMDGGIGFLAVFETIDVFRQTA